MKREHVTFVPPPPPKTPKAAATRTRLINVATDLFLEHGYSVVSMQDIAAKSELTKGAVYGHFRSKGQLLVEVIRWKLGEREHSPDFVDALQDIDSAMDLLWDQDGQAIRLLMVDAAAAARHDPDVAAGMTGLDRERQTAIRAALVGVVSDPTTVAWLISALSFGIGTKDAIALRPPPAKRIREIIQGFRNTEDSS